MNILFYLHQFPAIGGIETVTATMANYFTAKGHSVTIVSHISKPNAQETVALDARVCVLKMPEEDRVSRANTAFLQKTLAERDVELVIFQDSYAEIEKNLFARQVNGAAIVFEHSCPFCQFWHHLTRSPFVFRVLWHLRHPFWKWRRLAHEGSRKRFLYEKATRYVLLSNRFFGEFRAVTHLWDTRKLRAIPNPILPSAFRPLREKENEIVFASSLNWDKGLQRVLPIWEEIAVRYPDWRFTIVGDGEMMEWAKRYIRDNHVERVSLEGYRTDCAEYFARAKILVYPSSRDGWGLILVEAMANGCVPVAFDSYSAVRDIIDDGKNGSLVPAYDLDAYRKALLKYIVSPDELKEQSSAARQKVLEFAVDKIGHKWDALIEELSGGANSCGL